MERKLLSVVTVRIMNLTPHSVIIGAIQET